MIGEVAEERRFADAGLAAHFDGKAGVDGREDGGQFRSTV